MTFFKGLRCTFGCGRTFKLADPFTYDILTAGEDERMEAEAWFADQGWHASITGTGKHPWNGAVACQDHVSEWEEYVYATGNDSNV